MSPGCHYEVFPEIPSRWKEIHQRCLAGAVQCGAEDIFPQKKIFRISINDATNIQELTADPDATFESLTPEELTDRGINSVSKSVYADLTALGYSFTDKPEGLALVDENIVAVLNDNDFGETGVPIGLGLIVNQNGDNSLDASDFSDHPRAIGMGRLTFRTGQSWACTNRTRYPPMK